MIPSYKSGKKRPQIDESSNEQKIQEKALKITEEQKWEEQQEHLRNHAKPSIHTMKDSYKVYLASSTSISLSRSHHEALKLVLWKT
jgi:hypothetical protein